MSLATNAAWMNICVGILLFPYISKASKCCVDFTNSTQCNSPNFNNSCAWFDELNVNDSYCGCASVIQMDVMFGIDQSGSVGELNFDRIRQFIANIVDGGVGQNVRIGFIRFSHIVTMDYPLQYWDNNQLIDYALNMEYAEGWTDTATFFDNTISHFDSASNANRNKRIILITDGNPCMQGVCPYSLCDGEVLNNGDTYKYALESRGIQLIILGIGDSLEWYLLDCLAPERERLDIRDFTVLDTYCEQVQSFLCPLAPTMEPTTEPTVPSNAPTKHPTTMPSLAPTYTPTSPTNSPSKAPTNISKTPTITPSNAPTTSPTVAPTLVTDSPTRSPTSRCTANAVCLPVRNISLDWIFQSNDTANYYDSNGIYSISSGDPFDISEISLSECLIYDHAIANPILSIDFNYQYSYGYDENQDVNTSFTIFEIHFTEVYRNEDYTIFESAELGPYKDTGKWIDGTLADYTELIRNRIDINSSIPAGEYEITIIFYNNDHNVYFLQNTLEFGVNYFDEKVIVSDASEESNDEIKALLEYVTNAANVTVSTIENSLIAKSFVCAGNMDCILQCNDTASCTTSSVEISNHSSKVIILCNEIFSCLRATVSDLGDSSNVNISIVCMKQDSCNALSVNIKEYNNFNLYCVDEGSCTEAVIILNSTVLKENSDSIQCISASSCDSIHIQTTLANTKLFMNEYSDNVLYYAVNSLVNNDSLLCNNQQHIYWDIDVNETVTEQSMIDTLLTTKYDSTLTANRFPCEGVTMRCGTTKSCSMQYSISAETINRINSRSFELNCYYDAISNLQQLDCIGDCEFGVIGSPTQSPTLQTLIPTNSPSISPTQTPSSTPTDAPSISPSLNPSIAPSIAPSAAPTRVPTTQDEYDSFVDIIFLLMKLVNSDIIFITKDAQTVSDNMARMIESAYIQQEEIIVKQYYQFWIQISKINGYSVEQIDEDYQAELSQSSSSSSNRNYGLQLTLTTTLFCDEAECENLLKFDSENFDENGFTPFTKIITNDLRKYFGNSELILSVSSTSAVQQLNPTKPPDYIFYALLGVLFIGVLIGLFALLFNQGLFCRLPGFTTVDNARWTAVIIFTLQFWDFASDLQLSAEIWNRNDVFERSIILIAAVGSTLFIVIPYISNLAFAINIKKIVRDNKAATAWFLQGNTALYTILVVLTGGAYASLVLVSSNIFGLNMMSAGLTQYELKKMGKMKVFGTVVLENVPQLIIQALYSAAINDVTNVVLAAFIASALSIMASTLTYLIDRDDQDTEVVQYYLCMQCRSQSKEIEISDIQKQHLINHRGETAKLARSIAELFEVTPKYIEIGQSTITKHGLIMHVVQNVFLSDLEALEWKLNENNDGQQPLLSITGKSYISQLYLGLQHEIDDLFQNHFQLNNQFEVQFDFHGYRFMSKATNYYNMDSNEIATDDRDNVNGRVLKRMVTANLLSTRNKIGKDVIEISAINNWMKMANLNNIQMGTLENLLNPHVQEGDELETINITSTNEEQQNDVEMEMVQLGADKEINGIKL